MQAFERSDKTSALNLNLKTLRNASLPATP